MFRNILLVSSGGLVGQATTMLAIIVLSRLYDPEAFGLLGTFSAIVLILTAFVCGKFDLAVVMEKGNGRSGLLALAGLAMTVLITLISLLGVGAVTPFLSGDGVFARLAPYLWLVPIFVLAFGLQLMLSQMLVRRGAFHAIAIARIAQAAGTSGLQIALWGIGTAGLILGYVAGIVIAALVLLREISTARFYLRARWSAVLGAARDRRSFVISASSSAGLNIAAIQLPLILCALFFTAAETGFFTLSQRALALPAALLGLSVSQAFLHDLRSNTDPQARREAAVSVYNIVFAAGVAPTAFLMVYGPPLFSIAFGPEWEESGRISALLAPFLMSILLSTPFTNVFYVLGQPQTVLYHTAISLIIRILAFTIPALLGLGFNIAIISLAVLSFIPNVILVLLSLRLLGCSLRAFVARFLVSSLWVLALLLPGLALQFWTDMAEKVYVAMTISAIAVMVYMGLNVRRIFKEG